jgi:hypothetical protein
MPTARFRATARHGGAAARPIALGIELSDNPPLIVPGVLRDVDVAVSEKRYCAPDFHHVIKPMQRGRAVHPMETASHRDQTKSTERLVDVERAALSESHVGGEAFRRFRRNGQHFRLGIHVFLLKNLFDRRVQSYATVEVGCARKFVRSRNPVTVIVTLESHDLDRRPDTG